MKDPVQIDKAQVFIDSAHGVEGRTVLVLRFSIADVHIDITTATAGKIRKLNRVAQQKDERFTDPSRYMGGLKCDTQFGFCACGGYHYPPCTCGHARNVHGGLGNWCAVKRCQCVHYDQDHSWHAEEVVEELNDKQS